MLSDEQELAVFLSHLSYKKRHERQQFIDDDAKFKGKLIIDPENNREDFVSVHLAESNQVYNVHRGTTTSQDVLTDAYLASGRLHDSERYHKSRQYSRNIHQKYGQTNTITEIGHSLGGTLADQIARENGTQSISINMGTSPIADYGRDVNDDHQHIRTDNDPVSQFGTNATVTIPHEQTTMDSTVSRTAAFQVGFAFGGPIGGFLASKASDVLGHSLSNFSAPT